MFESPKLSTLFTLNPPVNLDIKIFDSEENHSDFPAFSETVDHEASFSRSDLKVYRNEELDTKSDQVTNPSFSLHEMQHKEYLELFKFMLNRLRMQPEHDDCYRFGLFQQFWCDGKVTFGKENG